MAIKKDDKGFFFWPDAWGTSALGLESDRLQLCIEEVQRRGMKGIFGARFFGFHETDLECLRDLPELTTVEFWDCRFRSIEQLYSLRHLTYLRLSDKRPPLDFSRLPNLTHLVITYNPRDEALKFHTQLRLLNLWHHKKKTDKQPFRGLPEGLEELGLFWSNIENLGDLGKQPNVRFLEIARCRNLQDLGELKNTFPRLEKLVVTACGRLTAESAARSVEGLAHIRHAFAGKKLLVSGSL